MMRLSHSDASVRELALTVFETNGRLVEAGNRLVSPVGLTTARWQVLGALGYSPHPLPVAHIARNMGLTRQAVQRVVDLLTEQGLVDHRPNPHHQRAKLVVLTPTGRAALGGAEAAVAPLDRAILEQIGRARIKAAIAVLREMNAAMDRELGAAARTVSEPAQENEK
jgi:DNA-binding MarR family transcriptional regulator